METYLTSQSKVNPIGLVNQIRRLLSIIQTQNRNVKSLPIEAPVATNGVAKEFRVGTGGDAIHLIV